MPKPYKRKVLKKPLPSAKKEAFLEAYAMFGVITTAAKAVGISRDSHLTWLQNDPDYPQRFADAREAYVERLIAEATRRACDGTLKMRFHNGKAIQDPRTHRPYVDREYSDSLLMFLIKKERPEYREASTLHLQGRVQTTAQPVDLTDAQLAAIAAKGMADAAKADEAAQAAAQSAAQASAEAAEQPKETPEQ